MLTTMPNQNIATIKLSSGKSYANTLPPDFSVAAHVAVSLLDLPHPFRTKSMCDLITWSMRRIRPHRVTTVDRLSGTLCVLRAAQSNDSVEGCHRE
jgi:hypothetical protein